MKIRYTSGAAFLGAAALIVTTAVPGLALSDDPSPAPAVKITESEDGFDFQLADPQAKAEKNELHLLRSLDNGDGDSQQYLLGEGGEPVVTFEQFALPDFMDADEAYEQALASLEAQKDAPPSELAPGEEPVQEQSYSADELAFDEADLRPRSAFAVTPSEAFFYLKHDRSYDDTEYNFFSVRRDGELIAVHQTPVFSDKGLQPDTEYNYEIVASEADPRDDSDGSGSLFATTRKFNVTTPPSGAKAAKLSALAAPKYPVWTQAYMHTTFIPEANTGTLNVFIGAGCGTAPHDRISFGGDDRRYQTPNFQAPNIMPSHRTMMFVNVAFDNPGSNKIITRKSVGPTNKYVNEAFHSTKYAGMDKMLFEGMSASTTYAQVTFNHQGGNPHCIAGAITYHDEVRFYRTSNMVEFTGWRFPVPNHEISTRYDTPAAPGTFWLPAAWRGTQSFGCLMGTCARDTYSGQLAGL